MSPHRNLLRFPILMVLIAGCGDGRRAAVGTSIPQMNVLNPVVDVRTEEGGGSAPCRAVIRVQNNGKTPASIHGVRAGCGCTDVKSVPNVPIVVGESAEIELSVRVPEFGDQTVRVTIDTIPPAAIPLTAELKLHGKPQPVPRMLFPVGDVRLSLSPKATGHTSVGIQTWEKPGSSPALRGFRFDSPHCRVELGDGPAERVLTPEIVERKYLVRIEGTSSSGEALGVVSVIPTFDPSAHDAQPFRVLIETRSQIRAIPAVINVSAGSLPIERQILLTSNTAEWTCQPRDNWPDWIRLSSLEDISSPGQRVYRLKVTISPPASISSSEVSGTICMAVSGSEVDSVTSQCMSPPMETRPIRFSAPRRIACPARDDVQRTIRDSVHRVLAQRQDMRIVSGDAKSHSRVYTVALPRDQARRSGRLETHSNSSDGAAKSVACQLRRRIALVASNLKRP